MDNFRDPLNDRFEFRQSGNFYMRTKHAHTIYFFVIVTAVLISFLFPTLLMWLTGVTPGSDRFGLFIVYYGLTSGFVVLVVWAAALIVINIIRHGQKCSYTADENGLKLYCGWRHAEYRYEDVKFVTYIPITEFGKMAGYTVKILKTDGNTDEYLYLSPYKGKLITQESTPFYLLQHPPMAMKEAKQKETGIVF